MAMKDARPNRKTMIFKKLMILASYFNFPLVLHKIKSMFSKFKRGNIYLNCPHCKKTLADYNFKCRKHEGTACEYTRKGYIKESDYYPKRMPDYEG